MAEATMKHEEKSEFFENAVTYYNYALSVLADLHKKGFVDINKNMKCKSKYLEKIEAIYQLKKEIDPSSIEEVGLPSKVHRTGIFGGSLRGVSSEGSPSAAPQKNASPNAA